MRGFATQGTNGADTAIYVGGKSILAEKNLAQI